MVNRTLHWIGGDNITLIVLIGFKNKANTSGSWYQLLWITEFSTFLHCSVTAGKKSVYGLNCPFSVYLHWCEGYDRELFKTFLHWEGGKTLNQKKRIYKEKDKGAHIWAVVRKSGNNALPPQRIVLQSYLASCRHLWYMWLFPHSHLLHWGSSGSFPFNE